MHSLIRILVSSNSCLFDSDMIRKDRTTAIENIREFAADMTEDKDYYYYEWRTTETASNWSKHFPENVILGAEHPEIILEQLENCKNVRRNTIENCISAIAHSCGTTDLTDICKKDLEENKYVEQTVLNTLYELVSTLQIRKSCSTHYYDTENRTNQILDSVVADVTANPQNWAMVLFDYCL